MKLDMMENEVKEESKKDPETQENTLDHKESKKESEIQGKNLDKPEKKSKSDKQVKELKAAKKQRVGESDQTKNARQETDETVCLSMAMEQKVTCT
jgi:hypothetical protein